MIPHQYFSPQFPQQNIISGQILQVNGQQGISNFRFVSNSSALIADMNKNIIYRCVADSLGNVSTLAFDIFPHKDEEQVKQEQSALILADLAKRIERLENEYTSKWCEPDDEPSKANNDNGKGGKQSASYDKSNNAKQS